ncbi:hypothetical protein ACNFYU_10580 [Klebsiella oxytoca]|uniref:hypothetical protein n=1 Tax=Klebsiella oxytoca TaxID=571 RepID=UPI003D04CE0A
MNIETVNELIQSLESAGELSIKETKVMALAKAQKSNEFLKGQLSEIAAELLVAKERIAELESRTVTVKQYDEFQICHYGATEDYAKGYIDCQNNFSKWLTAAGIKWEAE